MTPQNPPLRRRTAWALYAAVASLYLLTASGRIGEADELAMFNVTQSLATHGSLSADPCVFEIVHCVPGVDGRHYAAYGLAPSILAVPAYLIGKAAALLLHTDVHMTAGFFVSLSQALFTALAPLILMLWLKRIGLGNRAAIWTALVYAFASGVWGASKSFGSQPYFTLAMLGSCYLLSLEDDVLPLVGAGACFGLACGCRINGLVVLPAVVLYGLLLWRSRGAKASKCLVNLIWFGIPIAFCMGLIAAANYVRFGGIFRTGYHLMLTTVSGTMSTPLLEGMRGLLFDRQVGLFWWTPWLFVVPFLWPRFWNRYRAEAILVLGMSLITFLFYSKFVTWDGGWALGPRYLYPILPFMMVPVAVLFDDGRAVYGTLLGRVTILVLGITLLLQIVMTAYPTSRYYTMEVYNRDHGIHAWYSGHPVYEAVASLPELLAGVDNRDGDPARQFLLTFPNSVNLVRGDLWLIKVPMLGVPLTAAAAVAALLLLMFALAVRTLGTSLARS